MTGDIAPKIFVQLDLESYRELVRQDPFRQVLRMQLFVVGREQHLATACQSMLAGHCPRPLVVGAIADHELHLVGTAQCRDVLHEVPVHLPRAWGLQIHDAHHTRVQRGDGHGAAGLDGHGMAGVTEAGEQPQAVLLRQGFTAGDSDMLRAILRHFSKDFVEAPPIAAVESVGRVAVAATQGTPGQAHEHGRPADAVRLPLDRMEDLRDPETLRGWQVIPPRRAAGLPYRVHRISAPRPACAANAGWRDRQRLSRRSSAPPSSRSAWRRSTAATHTGSSRLSAWRPRPCWTWDIP